MNLKTKVICTEREFPRIFTNVEERDYGLMFYNTENPVSYDSNHAVLYGNRISDLEVVLKEIKNFYTEKRLVPRIYNTGCEQYFRENIAIFEKNGYQVTCHGMNRYNQLIADNKIISSGKLNVQLIKEWDERIATDIFYPDEDTFSPTVIKKSMKSSDNYTFVGYSGDKAVSTASVYHSPYGVLRLDSVETAAAERGKGYAREMMSTIVKFYHENFKNPFILWAANDTAARVYADAGFRYIFELEASTAVYLIEPT